MKKPRQWRAWAAVTAANQLIVVSRVRKYALHYCGAGQFGPPIRVTITEGWPPKAKGGK